MTNSNLIDSGITLNSRIAVLYGGFSSERDVSLRSGQNCFDALQRLGYKNSVLIDVQSDIATLLTAQRIEVAYIALHGQYGEDGCIQGILEWLRIPYTGCGVTASALCMNKALTKTVLKTSGLPVIDSVVFQAGEAVQPETLIYPLMVKPLCEGSSIGMSKVNKAEELEAELKKAFECSSAVMTETYVSGKSLTVGVIEIDGKPTATPVLELHPTKSEWYDLEAKYTEGGTEFILPANLDETTTATIQKASVDAFVSAGCQGVARIDFVTDSQNNRFYILEINTIPGMTNLSDLPAQANAMGLDYDKLVEQILKTACTKISSKKSFVSR